MILNESEILIVSLLTVHDQNPASVCFESIRREDNNQ